MVERSKLIVGTYYFYITYEDPELRVPVIETLRYMGQSNEAESGVPFHTFERIGASRSPKNCRLTEDLFTSLHDWDGLIEELVANKRAQDAGNPFD
jgi:hypothetical protein